MVESSQAQVFNVQSEIERIQQPEVIEQVASFLNSKEQMQIRVTTSQQVVNMNDHKDTALVIDMRSQKQFAAIKLEKSVNFALERFNEESFFKWTKTSKELETDATIFKTKST